MLLALADEPPTEQPLLRVKIRFGVVQLFDYRNQDASAIDGITGGMCGIRLDNLVSGVNAFEALAGAKLHTSGVPSPGGRGLRHNRPRDRYRYVCVVLASQVLTLLDAFIFPDNLDAAKAALSQLHGLALVRSTEPRLGQSQGTLLASLVRLSLVLLAYLEPSSVKFLQACSRLRCFLHWVLEILRESVALGGYSQAFHELTAPLDRMVLAIVLQCHRALSRCSAVLVEMESSPWQKYFPDVESRQKGQRRLFRAVLELREIVLAAYRGRNEVLRAALSPSAHEALSRGLEEVAGGSGSTKAGGATADPSPSKEASLRAFLENDWVAGFHDVEGEGSLVVPEQVVKAAGRRAIGEIAKESGAIAAEYACLLDAPFAAYCEGQRRWAETDAVRDREYEGDAAVKHLSSRRRQDAAELHRATATGRSLAGRRLARIARLADDPWEEGRHWMFTAHTDLLYRRILFRPNYEFDDHADASYELTLGRERETYQREEAVRREREVAKAALRAAIVPYREDNDDDGAEDCSVEGDTDGGAEDKEGFLGWDADGGDDSSDPSELDDDGSVEVRADGGEEGASPGGASHDGRDDADESEWDQIDSAELDGTDADVSFTWARKFMWAEGERPVHGFKNVTIVTLRTTRAGTLLLTSHGLYFRQTGDAVDVVTKERLDGGRNGGSPSPLRRDERWRLGRLTDVHGRRHMLKAQALELFFANMEGESRIIIFADFDIGSKLQGARKDNSGDCPHILAPAI